MTDFGDTEPEDAYAEDSEPDPFQLAIHFHRVRKYLENAAGRPFPDWEDVPEDERELAEAMFAELVAWLKREGPL